VTRRAPAVAALAGWLGFLSATLACLDALGPWLTARDPATTAFAFLRTGLVGVAWYLVAVTIASTILRLVRADAAATVVESRAPAPLRRLVRAAAGLTVAASVAVTTTAAAAERPEDVVTMRRLPDAGAEHAGDTVTMTRLPDAAPAPAAEPPVATWTIRAGDHLWRVARLTLAAAWHRSPTDADIDPYWRRLIDENRSRLRHPDDPDLVLPGDVFVLPPTPEANPAP
jgi:nucleoid-associated protein YgaU